MASDQSINTKEYQGDNDDTIKFFSKVHLLAGKLVPVVMIHSLGGSHADRHHTPNPQPGATQPTQDEDTQATHNPLELPLALLQERHKNPSAVHWTGADGATRGSTSSLFSPPLIPLQMCQHHKCFTITCKCVSIFTIIFQRLITFLPIVH